MSNYSYLKKLLLIFDKNLITIFPLIILFLISTLIELLSIALIAPYISFLLEPSNKIFLQNFLDVNLDIYTFNQIIIFLSGLLLLIFIVKFFLALLVRFAIKRFSLKRRRELQIRLLKSYQSMSYASFITRGSSDFIKNVRELSGDCITTLDGSLRILSEAIVFIAIVSYLFWIQPMVVLSLLSIIILIILIHNYTLKPKTIIYGKNRTEALSYIYQAVDEGLKGFKEVKILGKENYFRQTQKIGLDKIYINELKSELILFYPRYLYELVIVIFIISYVTIKLNYGMQSIEMIPLIGTFSIASLRIIPSISIISSCLIGIQYSYFAIDIIYKDIISLINNKKNSVKSVTGLLNNQFKSIELRDVKFKYPNTDDYIFDGLNLEIKGCGCVGIIGENGSGKSTLVDILLGFLKVNSGKIFFNNKETENLSDFTSSTGYLPQDHLIISDKVKKNISLEIDENQINLKKLNKVIDSVNLEKMISKLPSKIETLIGNDGIRLSGGEYKKIALARLFYHNKDFLILDEATNSLDKKSEEIIINELNKIKKDKTIIIISHNKNALSTCDVIYEIKNKRIELKK